MSVCYHINRTTGNIMAAMVRDWNSFSIDSVPSDWVAGEPFQGVEIVCSSTIPSSVVQVDFDGVQDLTVIPVNNGSKVPVPDFGICSFIELRDLSQR